jgi:hypothetical protein
MGFDDNKRTRVHQSQGLIDQKGNITPKGEAIAEERHFGTDEPTVDENYPTEFGWAPNPFPGGGLI